VQSDLNDENQEGMQKEPLHLTSITNASFGATNHNSRIDRIVMNKN